ncbi:MAG: peptidoglycan-binding protein [Candidatus Sericytochromatia bacterium]|nr:peptidoglycan-binding protein [Candidatus Sericytochromatia bacterium]
MDPRISSLGSEVLSDLATRKPMKAGRTAPLNPNDLKLINVNNDNKITTDELKGALAQKRGVAVETLTFLPEEEAGLAEDARDLTSFLRRGGKLEAAAEPGFAYAATGKQPTLNDLRTADNAENPISLGLGAKGEDVRKLHVLLNNLHAHDEDYSSLNERNDVYNETVKNAIAEFQKNYNLLGTEGVSEGVLDGKTLRALERAVEGVIKESDIYAPYVPISEMPGVPDNDPKRLEALQKISDQLGAKGLTSTEIEQAFQTGHDLSTFAQEAIAEVECKYKGGSESFCYTGVKESMEGALNYRYQVFSGKGGTWASTADENIFKKRPDLFAELTLSREELNYLPPGAIVVYEPGGVGHIGIKGYNAEGKQLDLSDRVRTGRPYPNAKYKVFLPLKPAPQGDRNFATEKESQDLSHLEYAARETLARRKKRR